ncbi:hypothetical protein [Rhizobium sp. RAF56]
MSQEARNHATSRDEEWQSAVMMLALPLAIVAVSFGCQFFM